jgi:hypothetical protein
MMNPLAELVFNSPRLWPLAVAAAVIVIVVVWGLYRAQTSAVRRPWRWLLPALRCIALVALIFSILKPVAIRPAKESDSGAILILVDHSRSMSVRDLAYLSQSENSRATPRGASYLISLADGLGLLNPGTRDQALVGLRAEIQRTQNLLQDLARARGELDFARASGQGVTLANNRVNDATAAFQSAAQALANRAPEFAAGKGLSDALASMHAFASGIAGGRISPAAGALTALIAIADRAQSDADAALYESDPDVRAVCDKLAGMSRFDRVEMALTNPGTGLLRKFSTDIPLFGYSVGGDDPQNAAVPLPLRGGGQPVRQLLIQPDGSRSDLTGGLRSAIAQTRGQPLAAIVLLSDGQPVGGDAFLPSAVSAAGVPIFPVYCANPADLPLRDVSVSGLSVPNNCFVGETLTARVELRSSQSSGSVANVSVAVDEKAPTSRPALLLDRPVTVEFPVKFDAPGVHRLTAGIPAAPEAATDENKHLQRWVKVFSDKVHVGLYAGSAGWDFQYVRNALTRTSWVDLTSGLFSNGSARLNLSPDEILKLDLLVLFDVPVSALSDQQWDAVNRLVNERGGSVIFVAGDEHLPGEYAGQELASSLLPYPVGQRPVWRVWPGSDPGFYLEPAAGAMQSDALKLIDTGPVADRWGVLPAMFRYLYIPNIKPNFSPLLVERDSGAPVLLEGRIGAGRSFFLGTTETWRWRYKVGETDQDRFWLQLIRHAADAPYAAHGNGVALDADAVTADPSATIHLRAKAWNPDGTPSTAETQQVDVITNEGIQRTVQLVIPEGGAAGHYQGTVNDLSPGSYVLRLASVDNDQNAELPIHIAQNFEAEMANISGNPQFLRTLADSSGGTFLSLDQVGTLPDLIARGQSSQNLLTAQPLWDSYYLYFLVVACLAAEWAVRKRVGLV